MLCAPVVCTVQPTPLHLTVKEFVTPEKFDEWRAIGESMGFRYVASGPLVSLFASPYPCSAMVLAAHTSPCLKLPQVSVELLQDIPLCFLSHACSLCPSLGCHWPWCQVRSSYRAGEFFVESMLRKHRADKS